MWSQRVRHSWATEQKQFYLHIFTLPFVLILNLHILYQVWINFKSLFSYSTSRYLSVLCLQFVCSFILIVQCCVLVVYYYLLSFPLLYRSLNILDSNFGWLCCKCCPSVVVLAKKFQWKKKTIFLTNYFICSLEEKKKTTRKDKTTTTFFIN